LWHAVVEPRREARDGPVRARERLQVLLSKRVRHALTKSFISLWNGLDSQTEPFITLSNRLVVAGFENAHA